MKSTTVDNFVLSSHTFCRKCGKRNSSKILALGLRQDSLKAPRALMTSSYLHNCNMMDFHNCMEANSMP